MWQGVRVAGGVEMGDAELQVPVVGVKAPHVGLGSDMPIRACRGRAWVTPLSGRHHSQDAGGGDSLVEVFAGAPCLRGL